MWICGYVYLKYGQKSSRVYMFDVWYILKCRYFVYVCVSLQVSALAFNANTTVLASAQSGSHSVVRVWNYHKGMCMAMFRTHAHSLSSLRWTKWRLLTHTFKLLHVHMNSKLKERRSIFGIHYRINTHTHLPFYTEKYPNIPWLARVKLASYSKIRVRKGQHKR